MRNVYADNAATTQVRKEVVEAMMPCFMENYGNPSSLYKIGVDAKVAIDKARAQVASVIGAKPNEIYFTSGGSESDNWAIKSAIKMKANKGKHIITSAIEHHAILHALQALEKEGYEVTYLEVGSNGIVKPEDVLNAIRPDTVLITIMFANNEIGTIQPIKEIGKIAKEKSILFHTDAVQAFGHEEIDVNEMNIDFLSISAHKLYAPKGVGALYARAGMRLTPLIYGGGQERSKRAGTENVPSIVGFGVAAELAQKEMKEEHERLAKMRDRLIDGVLSTIPYSRLNGDRTNRLAGNANFSIEFIEGESLLLLMDLNGISCSSGSACTSGSLDPSHVLLALGLKHEVAHGSLRISLGRNNTEEDIDWILEALPKVVTRLRAMSPLWKG